MTTAFDPEAHGLGVGPWLTSPDWQVFFGDWPDPLPEYAQMIGTFKPTATPTVSGYRKSTTPIVHDGPRGEPSGGINRKWGGGDAYSDTVQSGVTALLEPDLFLHFQAEADAEGSYHDLIWDDGTVCGVELEGDRYVYLWDPEWEKTSTLPLATYLQWNPERAGVGGPPDSGFNEWLQWSQTESRQSSVFESFTVPFRVQVTNSVTETVFTLHYQYPVGEGQVKVATEPFDYDGSVYYKPFDRSGSTVVYSGKRANSPTAPNIDTTLTLTIPADGVWRNYYAEWSERADEQGSYPSSPTHLLEGTVTLSPPAAASFIGTVGNPIRWRVIYGGPQLTRPRPLRQSGRTDGLIGAARQGPAALTSQIRQGRTLVR